MKLHIFSSRFKIDYLPIKEIPQKFCVSDGCVVTVKRKETCPKPNEMDRPFGKIYEEVCCENC